tara:strand:+ start:7788 stop:8471 length:684 start_codon:yes stop_codon:yes gene_type:complete
MYIPKSRILTNQYSNDNKLVYKSTGEIYTGFYYKTFEGKYFTGKTQNDPPNDELILVEDVTVGDKGQNVIQNSLAYSDAPTIFNNIDTPGYSEPMVVKYANLNKIDLNKTTYKLVPNSHYPTPNPEDYAVGSFTRYFCVKVNQPIWLEISSETFDNLDGRNNGWLWEPYQLVTLQWALVGSENYVATTNKNLILLEEKRNKVVGLLQFLRGNYLKFYRTPLANALIG